VENHKHAGLGNDGYVLWIINRAEDVTELVKLRQAVGASS
jgi:hypothetical protein